MLKSGIYDFVICRGGTDMCFVLGFGRERPDLKQYHISGLTGRMHLAASIGGGGSSRACRFDPLAASASITSVTHRSDLLYAFVSKVSWGRRSDPIDDDAHSQGRI